MTTEAEPPTPGLTVRELRDHITNAFIAPQPSTVDLLEAAIRSHARPVVFAAINRLPNRRFDSVVDVVAALPADIFGG